MDRYMYYAVFEPCEKGGYSIYFPDLPSCITEGDDLSEALAMAKDALELHMYCIEEDSDDIPQPTPPEKIKVAGGDFVVPIIADMKLVRTQISNKTANITVTVPQWLKDRGEESDLNFSQLLQEAVQQKLNITD